MSPTPTLEPIRFGEFLLERKAISDGEYLDALADHFAHGGRFGLALCRRGILSSDQVEELAAEYHALRVVVVEVAHGSAMR
jgi:hypothetical protein